MLDHGLCIRASETPWDIPAHTPTLEEVKTAKLSEINAAAEGP